MNWELIFEVEVGIVKIGNRNLTCVNRGTYVQKSVESKVFEYCDKHHMLQKGDNVVLGVSGGADSVCLLFMLLSLKEKLELNLHVVHVNHGIRTEAKADADYVATLCKEKELPFYLFETDISTLAGERGCSMEEAGRQYRYEAFGQVMKEQKCQKIAVAHNCNDRAETMLFHLFRGTGLTGLAGIRPVREQIIRPLLCLERGEIEEYLREQKISYRHDSTNDSDDYTRNKIRHHILPYAEQEIVQGSVANMSRAADILVETENYIEGQLEKLRLHCVVYESGEICRYRIDRNMLQQEHGLMQKRLLLQLLKELAPGHKDIAAVHVEDVCGLLNSEGNGEIHLPYGIRARNQYQELILEAGALKSRDKGFGPISLLPEDIGEEELEIPLGYGRRMYLKRINCEENSINLKDIPQNQYTKWFDYDKIIGCLMIRIRKEGDYFTIRSGEVLQHKKVKDYMIAEKIPKKRREEIPMLVEGAHVLWLVGYRISEYYKVEKETRQILQVRFEQMKEITER